MSSNNNALPMNLDLDIEDTLDNLRDRLRVRCEAYTAAAEEVDRLKELLVEAEANLKTEAAKLRPLHDQLNKIAIANGQAAKPKTIAAKKVEKKPAKKPTNGQTWGQFLATLKGANATNKELLADIEKYSGWWKAKHSDGKRPAEARADWLKERAARAPDPAPTPKKSKVKSSPTPPAKLDNIRIFPSDRKSPEEKYREKAQEEATAAIDAKPEDAEHDWLIFADQIRQMTGGGIELQRGPVLPEQWSFFQQEWKAGRSSIQALDLWRNLRPHTTLKHSDAALFDSGTGPPDQPPHQKLSWEQWAHGVRTCQDAKSCKDWPQTSSNIAAFRQPLVDREDKAVRCAYLAGRKPAAAARALAKMFAVRASRADRSHNTRKVEQLSEEEEKALKGEKVGAAS